MSSDATQETPLSGLCAMGTPGVWVTSWKAGRSGAARVEDLDGLLGGFDLDRGGKEDEDDM